MTPYMYFFVFLSFIHPRFFYSTTLYNVKHDTEKQNHWIKLGATRDIKTADKMSEK